jgi:hypothetical protein
MKDLAISNISRKISHDINQNQEHDENYSIGILQIDYEYPAALGDICHPDSFGHKVHYEKIKGLTFEAC